MNLPRLANAALTLVKRTADMQQPIHPRAPYPATAEPAQILVDMQKNLSPSPQSFDALTLRALLESAAAGIIVIDSAGIMHAVNRAAERGVYLRDRSREPGLEGCLRVGTGIVAHTDRCIEVFEEVLCAAE